MHHLSLCKLLHWLQQPSNHSYQTWIYASYMLYRQGRHNNYPLFFSDTQLCPSSTLNILSLSFTYNLNWKLHISSLAKTTSKKLSILSCLHQFFSPPQAANSIQGPYPSMYGVHFTCLGRFHSYSSLGQDGIKSLSSHQLLSFNWMSSASFFPPQCCLSRYLLPLFSSELLFWSY